MTTSSSCRATELRVMVLGPASGRAGGRTGGGLCGGRDRPADRLTFSGRPMDRRVRADLAARLRRPPVEKKQQTSAGGFFALGGMPEAEVADFMQAFRQDVLEEAAHELLAGDTAHPPAVGFAMLVADGDRLIVEGDDAGVGDGDAEDIAGEIIEHGLFALAPGRAMDDPRLGPCGVGLEPDRDASFGTRPSACRARAWPMP